MELEEGQPQLLLHTDVRWLSRGKFLQRFRTLLDEIANFLHQRNEVCPQLSDADWLCDLAFLVDFTAKLSILNLELQGRGKTLSSTISAVNSYKKQFPMLILDIQQKKLSHFEHMKDHLRKFSNYLINEDKYVVEIQNVAEDVNIRFEDFKKIEDVEYLNFPFQTNINAKYLSTQFSELFQVNGAILESEIITLQCDLFLKPRALEEHFWKFVCYEKYPNIKKCSEYFQSCFASTYLCESAFSYLKMIKTRYRGLLTDLHCEDSLRLSLSNYMPQYEKLVDDMKVQASH